jgi:hypothetical protein
MLRKTAHFLIAALSAGITLSGADAVPPSAEKAITTEGILKHIRILSSDEYEGRAPGSAGEQKSLDYIIAQCRAMKIAPGNPDGTYLQRVPLWGITSSGEVTMQAGDGSFPLKAGEDYRVTSTQPKTEIDLANTPIVFVGYGIVARIPVG